MIIEDLKRPKNTPFQLCSCTLAIASQLGLLLLVCFIVLLYCLATSAVLTFPPIHKFAHPYLIQLKKSLNSLVKTYML